MDKKIFIALLLFSLCSLNIIQCFVQKIKEEYPPKYNNRIAQKFTSKNNHKAAEKTDQKKKEDSAEIKKQEEELMKLEAQVKTYCQKEYKQNQEKISLCLLKLNNLPLTYKPKDKTNEIGKIETNIIDTKKKIKEKLTNEISKCLGDEQEKQNENILEVCDETKPEYKSLTDNQKLEKISSIKNGLYEFKCLKTVALKTKYNECVKKFKEAQLEEDKEEKLTYQKCLDKVNSQSSLSMQQLYDATINCDTSYNKEYKIRMDKKKQVLSNCLEGNA